MKQVTIKNNWLKCLNKDFVQFSNDIRKTFFKINYMNKLSFTTTHFINFRGILLFGLKLIANLYNLYVHRRAQNLIHLLVWTLLQTYIIYTCAGQQGLIHLLVWKISCNYFCLLYFLTRIRKGLTSALESIEIRRNVNSIYSILNVLTEETNSQKKTQGIDTMLG